MYQLPNHYYIGICRLPWFQRQHQIILVLYYEIRPLNILLFMHVKVVRVTFSMGLCFSGHNCYSKFFTIAKFSEFFNLFKLYYATTVVTYNQMVLLFGHFFKQPCIHVRMDFETKFSFKNLINNHMNNYKHYEYFLTSESQSKHSVLYDYIDFFYHYLWNSFTLHNL